MGRTVTLNFYLKVKVLLVDTPTKDQSMTIPTTSRVLYRIFFLVGVGGGGGGNVHAVACSYSMGVCKHVLSRGVWGHSLPGTI